MKSLNQLLLDFNYKQNFTDDDFYVCKSNFYSFELMNKWPRWEKNFVNISGEKYSGKSHLANIFLKKFNGIKIDSGLINNLDLVSNFYILSFNSEKVYYKIIYNGAPQKLLTTIESSGLDVENDNKNWNIK